MKYLLSSCIILFLLIACAKEDSTPTNDQNNDNGQNSDPQLTYVPDDNFEQALIDLGYDDVLDDYVLTSNISSVTDLFIDALNILDLTGIEDFVALTDLSCDFNQLTTLDVSQNTVLDVLSLNGNQLTSLDVSQNTALTYLNCRNNKLTSLDVSQNVALVHLFCQDNQLTSLDVSQNTALTILQCEFNNLTALDVSNGNNANFEAMNALDNNLTCIQIDEGFTPPTDGSWQKDPNTIYSTNCN